MPSLERSPGGPPAVVARLNLHPHPAGTLAWLAIIVIALASCSSGQDMTAARDDPFRPVYHYTAERNWINDPNGPVYLDGQYHLFYQYNPQGNEWGNMSWGHAVSDDLVHWEELPVAIPAFDDTMIFSGSAVYDDENTSGLCDDDGCLAAVFTAFRLDPVLQLPRQSQYLATSEDRGRTWNLYDGNPVIDLQETDFRDPNVFWHEETEQWVAPVVLPLRQQVLIFGSPNLREWELLSEFRPARPTGGIIWECPALIDLPVLGTEERAWLMKVDLNPGHVGGGSGGQYFVGTFDGRSFRPLQPVPDPNWVDYGRDFYCALQWTNLVKPGGERVWIGWMNDWTYASHLPTDPWRGQMSIPREIALRKDETGTYRLVQQPVTELLALREDFAEFAATTVDELNDELADAAPLPRAMDLEITLRPGDAEDAGIALSAGENEVRLGYLPGEGVIYIDRSLAAEGAPASFAANRLVAPVPADRELRLRVLIDTSSIEVFAQDGTTVISSLFFMRGEERQLRVFAEGGEIASATIAKWEMKP